MADREKNGKQKNGKHFKIQKKRQKKNGKIPDLKKNGKQKNGKNRKCQNIRKKTAKKKTAKKRPLPYLKGLKVETVRGL